MSRAAAGILIVLIVITTAAAVIFLLYSRDLSRARADANRGSQIVATAAGPIEYGERGTGTPLLVIHGAGGGYDHGLTHVADFADGDFRVIAPSRFGYLGTPVPIETSPMAQADAHAALLAALRVNTAIVVGISAGARSAAELAIRHPDRVTALILIVPGTYAPMSSVAVEGSRASALVLWLVNNGADFSWWMTEKIAPSILIRFIGVPPQVVASSSRAEQARVMRIVRSIKPLTQRFAGINIDSNPNLPRPSFDRITAPTLIISARDDLFNTSPAAEFAARTVPGAKLVIYDTGGHLLVGHQQDVRQLIHEFLSTQVSPSPLTDYSRVSPRLPTARLGLGSADNDGDRP
jgi:pimeloyl-ACP methyl ester carboxylesterase